jgi:cell division protein FtsB
MDYKITDESIADFRPNDCIITVLMLNKVYLFAKSWANEFKDVRSLGFVIFAVISLLVTWSTIGSIQTNYELQKQVARLQQENQVFELENKNLRLKNEYYNTDQYLELTARKQFGKAAPGETVYVIPRSTALAQVTSQPAQVAAAKVDAPTGPLYQRNFEAWMKFLLHRDN